jgi:hypothetical protein
MAERAGQLSCDLSGLLVAATEAECRFAAQSISAAAFAFQQKAFTECWRTTGTCDESDSNLQLSI